MPQPRIQQIKPLNKVEQDWVASELANARALVAAYSPDDAGRPLTLDALDRSFAAFRKVAEVDNGEQVNAAINAVGIAFGQHLVGSLGLLDQPAFSILHFTFG